MKRLNVIFNEGNRSIDVSFKIKCKETDEAFFYTIIDIVRKHHLECNFGEDDKSLRYFHISGVDIQKVKEAYEKIEKLNS